MLAALIALLMVFVWFSYVAASAIAIASGDAKRLLIWAVATPIVLMAEVLSFKLLDRTASFG